MLGSAFREGEAIYLWLQLHDTPEPRSYVLPWSRDLAEQLQTAQREAGENQGEVRMRLPFESSLDQLEPRFYAMPQLESPPKDLDGTHPQLYQRRPPSEA